MSFIVSVSNVVSGRADLVWPVIPGQAQYFIYECHSGPGCTPLTFVKFGNTENSTTISGLPSTTYSYQMIVQDSDGNDLDSSAIFQVTYPVGIPGNWGYYSGMVSSSIFLSGGDDISLTPQTSLIISPSPSNPRNNPFVVIRGQVLTFETLGCGPPTYTWQWQLYYRQNFGGPQIGPITLSGTTVALPNGCEFNPPIDTYGTPYLLTAQFRSNYHDLNTGITLANSGTLVVSINGSPILTVNDWNHSLNDGFLSVGWGTNRAIREIYVNGTNTNPVDPLDPNLILFQDFETPFVPAADITSGLIWYDPTFGNTGGGQIGVQQNGEIVSWFSSIYHAYTGVGIGVVLPRKATPNPGGQNGVLIVQKVVVPPNATPSFPMAAGGGLTPNAFSLHHGEMQVYNDVIPGAAYSIVETVPSGYTVGYSVSNGSLNTNISVGAGETVIVTVTNTVIPTPTRVRSGIYKIVPGKRQDTLWNNLSDLSTTDVKKPNPFAKLGPVGE